MQTPSTSFESDSGARRLRSYQQPSNNNDGVMLFDNMPFGASPFRPEMDFGRPRYSTHPTKIPVQRMDRESPLGNRRLNGSPDQPSSESVVYNIPIHVEGRDDSPTPAPFREYTERRPISPPKERQIPISFGEAVTCKQARPGASASRGPPAAPDASGEDQPQPGAAPVTGGSSKQRDRSSSPIPAAKKKKTPEEQIEEAIAKLDELRGQVDQFSGTSTDKHFRYLDEMLTRLLISLDNVDTDGNEELRVSRKETVKNIQRCAEDLERKASGSQNLQPAVEAEETVAVQDETVDHLSSNPNASSSDSSESQAAQSDPADSQSDDQMETDEAAAAGPTESAGNTHQAEVNETAM